LTVGERIKRKRKEKGLPLKLLSGKCKLSISFLSDIEQGRRKPSLDRLKDIAEGLDTTVSFLLGEEKDTDKFRWQDRRIDNNIYSSEDKSQEFREVLEKIEGFDNWSYEDRVELLTYLKVKEKIRNSKQGYHSDSEKKETGL
jgi:transcriptional regulator with XRE-family HTH domain